MTAEFSYPKDKIKILLLENIHAVAVEGLREGGYSVKEIPRSVSPEELLEEIKDVHVLGIRSKTKVQAEHFAAADRLRQQLLDSGYEVTTSKDGTAARKKLT